jgi:RNA polymerase sigma factor (sigma-70 family)
MLVAILALILLFLDCASRSASGLKKTSTPPCWGSTIGRKCLAVSIYRGNAGLGEIFGKESSVSRHYHQLAGVSLLEVVRMAVRLGGRAIREIRTLFDWGAIGSWTDKQLLSQFSTGGEGREAALRVLINRHAPMVMGICRRVLGDEAAAEDAFQATFLILVKKADSLRGYEMLTNWIYGVALRVAKKDRARTARRRVVERRAADARTGWPGEELENAELRSVVDEEVARLPDRYRLPMILCYLEGLRHEEIARRLGCPVGTVESRLSRARERLRARLTRRGLSPTYSALALVLNPPNGPASVLLTALVARTLDTAVKLSPEKAGGFVALARWLSGRVFCLGPSLGTGIVVSTLLVCAALVASKFSVLGAAGRPPQQSPAPSTTLPSMNPKTDGPGSKEVPAEDARRIVDVPSGARLNGPKAESKAATVRSEPTAVRPATVSERLTGLNRTTAKSESREPSNDHAFPIPALVAGPQSNATLKPSRASTAFASPLSGITIDGQLDDWPIAIARNSIDKLLVFGGIGTGGLFGVNLSTSVDLSAAFSVGYDPSEQLLYLAVIVRDDKLVIGHSSHLDTDSLEVYIDGLLKDRPQTGIANVPSEKLDLADVPVQQYVAIPGKGMIYGQPQASNPILMAGSLSKTKTRMAYTQKGDVTTYEWAIQVFDRYPDKPTKLEPGKRIGFDIAVVDKDVPATSPGGYNDAESEQTAWIYWCPLWRQNKMFDAGALGEVVLVK